MSAGTHNSISAAPAAKYVTLSAGDLAALVAAERCPACPDPKAAGRPLCPTCLHALPLYLRNWLARGPRDAYFAENARRALQHLRDSAALRSERAAARWPWRTPDELVAAGFVFQGEGRCRRQRCRARLAWLHDPRGNPVAVDLGTWRPHAESCADPHGPTVKPRLQSSAKRARRKA